MSPCTSRWFWLCWLPLGHARVLRHEQGNSHSSSYCPGRGKRVEVLGGAGDEEEKAEGVKPNLKLRGLWGGVGA